MNRENRSPGIVTLLLLFGAVVFGMVLAGSLDLSVPSVGKTTGESAAARSAAENGPRRVESSATVQGLPSFADLAEAVLPAVVSVHTTKIARVQDHPLVPDELFDRFFRRRRAPDDDEDREFRTDSGGSGFFISSDGWLVTNYHVIEDATSVEIRIDGREYPAEIKGEDPSTDLALLKVKGDDFDYLALGSAESLRVGDWVMAVGSPLALESSVSVGVVSAKGRSNLNLPGLDVSFENFIQTDAAINRGNSGGPLVNLAGEVIGISSAMSFGAENIGFAIPVDTLRGILPQLREEGKVSRGYLGVNITNIDYETMRGFGLDSTNGALVNDVTEDSPAEKAGLEPGDVILKVDDHRVEATRDLIDYVSAKTPGTAVEVELLRNGKELSKRIELEERPDLSNRAAVEPPEPEEDDLEWLGIQYGDLTRELRERIEAPRSLNGVVVMSVAPSSPLYLEVARGDIISQVNGINIRSAEDFGEAVAGARSGDFLRLYAHSIRSDGTPASRFVIVQVP